MKAIDTEYNGYKFRSRLEARWAVFFDTLGVKYEYELQGFEFEDGTRYLPDFWLPEYKIWVEIKPDEPSDEERRKAYLLSCGHKSPVVLLFGGVGLHTRNLGEYGRYKFPNHQMELYCGDFWDTFDCPSRFMQWVESFRFESLSEFLSEKYGEPFVFDGSRESIERMIEADKRYFWSKYGKEHWAYKFGRHMDRFVFRYDEQNGIHGDMESICTFSKDEIAAHNAASTARFEFGQTPNTR